MTFEENKNISISHEAIKKIKALDKPARNRVLKKIYNLPAGDVKKLQGYKDEYRLRIGDLRVLFSMNSDIIVIKDVLPRGNAYNNL